MKALGWRIALYFALVFAGGVAVGALTHRYVATAHASTGFPPPPSAERFRKAMIEDMTKRLKLDPAQVQQFEQVLDTSRKEFQDFRERHKDEMKAIHDRQRAAVTALLRPEQRAAYDKLLAERDAQMKRGDH